MVTAVDEATALVVAVKLALPAPAGTVTLAGAAAAPGLLLERETTAPPLGAGPLRVTVPVEDCVPPITLVGLSVSEIGRASCRERVDVTVGHAAAEEREL